MSVSESTLSSYIQVDVDLTYSLWKISTILVTEGNVYITIKNGMVYKSVTKQK